MRRVNPRATSMLLAGLFTLAGCERAPPPLFPNRKEVAPLRARLQQSGGDVSRVIRVNGLVDLTRLNRNTRYKFSLPADGVLRVAPLPADMPGNEYVHPILVDGESVRTAGGITVRHDGVTVSGAVLDRDSRAYCPTEASLASAVDALAALGVPRAGITAAPTTPACEPPLPGAAR